MNWCNISRNRGCSSSFHRLSSRQATLGDEPVETQSPNQVTWNFPVDPDLIWGNAPPSLVVHGELSK